MVGFLGEVLKVPHWVVELSPFQHTLQLPAAEVSVPSLVTLTAVAVALTGIGTLALRRRDVG